MSTTASQPFILEGDQSPSDACRIAVFYDDTPSRERAVGLAHHLTKEFWEEVDFSFSWWRFRYLADPVIAETAAVSAVRADILVYSVEATSRPDEIVLAWTERWLPQRGETVGAVVPLLHPATAEVLDDSLWISFVEEVARRGDMEILLPEQLRSAPLLGDATRGVRRRSQLRGAVLDGILQRGRPTQFPPSHWGLNE